MHFLYILDISFSLLYSLQMIFSHSVGCLFILSMSSFAVQRCELQLGSFIVASGGRSKKIFLQFISVSFLPMFSSRNFMVSGLTLRSLIHLEFILYMV